MPRKTRSPRSEQTITDYDDQRKLVVSFQGEEEDVRAAWQCTLATMKPDHVIARGKVGPQPDRYDESLYTVRYNTFVWDDK